LTCLVMKLKVSSKHSQSSIQYSAKIWLLVPSSTRNYTPGNSSGVLIFVHRCPIMRGYRY
jgi:hypothetical protein